MSRPVLVVRISGVAVEWPMSPLCTPGRSHRQPFLTRAWASAIQTALNAGFRVKATAAHRETGSGRLNSLETSKAWYQLQPDGHRRSGSQNCQCRDDRAAPPSLAAAAAIAVRLSTSSSSRQARRPLSEVVRAPWNSRLMCRADPAFAGLASQSAAADQRWRGAAGRGAARGS